MGRADLVRLEHPAQPALSVRVRRAGARRPVAVADLVSGRTPEIDLEGLAGERFGR